MAARPPTGCRDRASAGRAPFTPPQTRAQRTRCHRAFGARTCRAYTTTRSVCTTQTGVTCLRQRSSYRRTPTGHLSITRTCSTSTTSRRICPRFGMRSTGPLLALPTGARLSSVSGVGGWVATPSRRHGNTPSATTSVSAPLAHFIGRSIPNPPIRAVCCSRGRRSCLISQSSTC